MSRFYTVDRVGTLEPGIVLDLKAFGDIRPPELQAHSDRLFPEGYSLFGERYFVSPWQGENSVEPIIELVWEYVRRDVAPHAPSRFASVFAAAAKDEASLFRDRFGGGSGRILEVEADRHHRADMNLLEHRADSIIVMSYKAELYWSGQSLPGAQPIWEYLLEPPVSVLAVASA